MTLILSAMGRQLFTAMLVGALALLAAGCAATPPTRQGNICHVFEQYPDWYDYARKSAERWGTPVHVQMSFVRHDGDHGGGDAGADACPSCRSRCEGFGRPGHRIRRSPCYPRIGAARRARRGPRLARPGRLRRPRASPRLGAATLRAAPVSASPSTGSRTPPFTSVPRSAGNSAHRAMHSCPHKCGPSCGRRRRNRWHRAAHYGSRLCPHRPPLNRRGGSHPPASPAPFPLSLMPLLGAFMDAGGGWSSHPTRLQRNQQPVRACHAVSRANGDRGRLGVVGSSGC